MVGAGIVGAAVAEALAVRGTDVTVLDMRSPGRGASFASAGMLAPYSEAHDSPALLDLCIRSLSLFDAFIARVRAASGIDVEYARTGTLHVALDDSDTSRLEALRAALAERSVPVDLLSAERLRAFEPAVSPSAAAGVFIASHGVVRVSSLLAALVQSARLAGAVFEAPVEAASVESGRDRADVRAGERHYQADAVVIAAGSWSKRLRIANVAALPVRPVRGQLLQLTWPEGRIAPAHVVWGPRCYTVPWRDGSMFVGATVEEAGFDEHPTLAGVHALASAASALLPGIAAAHFDEVRVGLRPRLPDGLPAIGPVARAPRVVVASGHFRNGVLLAPLTADIVARYLLDGAVDNAAAAVSPDRFLP